MTDPREVTREMIANATLDEVGQICQTCGEKKRPEFFTEHVNDCDSCVRDNAKDAFQRALNAMPADFILTYNLVVATYYEGLGDKKEVGENIQDMIDFGKEAQEQKSKYFHS